MEVRYTLTVDEYGAFSLHTYRKSGVGRGLFLASWFLPPLTGLGLAAVLVQSGVPPVFAVGTIAAAARYGAIYPFVYRSMLESGVRCYAKRMGTRGVTGPITLILSEESLTEVTETTRSEVR